MSAPYQKNFVRSVAVNSEREEFTTHHAQMRFKHDTYISSLCALTQGAVGQKLTLKYLGGRDLGEFDLGLLAGRLTATETRILGDKLAFGKDDVLALESDAAALVFFFGYEVIYAK